ncbi:damage-inducible protein DinB [Aquibacillus halophilus]|uniref:Damage-inducible protein DinB n=1 Tax=Aquibacillus halophilus TaxID=930132 RepID=A0A6A8DFG4_9BACI|nr:damage-inducible protein DinB [Aquibacillus halophilus]
MYRKVTDFITDWANASKGTTQVFESMTDETLDQVIVEGHNSLGWLGWHLATVPAFYAELVGLNLKPSSESKEVPKDASTILHTYKKVSEELLQEAEQYLTDKQMIEEVDFFGRLTPRGVLLRQLIDHQTHHRGQMTVLLRQAGLTVPGIMGPTQENN